ncbi:MAG: hypothetical protein U0359_32605 [Byssovorax sp.]
MKIACLGSAFIVALASLAMGCASDEDPSEPKELISGEQLGETESGLGEVGCTTVSTDDDINSNYCSNESSTSPDTSYDHGASCPNQYVTEFTGSVSNIADFGEGWGDTAPTSTTCSSSHYSIGTYAYVSGNWQASKSAKYHGSWNGSSCDWVIDNGYSDPTTTANATKYRVAVEAYTLTVCGLLCLTKTKKKAKDFVFGTSCSP